jgi:hypothetical protein
MQLDENLFYLIQMIIMAASCGDQKVSMYTLTYSRVAIRFPIFTWKMSADAANPIGDL